MAAPDILFTDTHISVTGTLLAEQITVGTVLPARPVHIEGGELHCLSGFSFSDRSNWNFVETPTKGERFVWYANKGVVYLWSGENILQISSPAAEPGGYLGRNVMTVGTTKIGTDGVECAFVEARWLKTALLTLSDPKIPNDPGFDVRNAILALQSTMATIQADINLIKKKLNV